MRPDNWSEGQLNKEAQLGWAVRGTVPVLQELTPMGSLRSLEQAAAKKKHYANPNHHWRNHHWRNLMANDKASKPKNEHKPTEKQYHKTAVQYS